MVRVENPPPVWPDISLDWISLRLGAVLGLLHDDVYLLFWLILPLVLGGGSRFVTQEEKYIRHEEFDS